MSSTIQIRQATTDDFNAIVALNESEVMHTSPMTIARLGELDALANYHRVVLINDQVAGFLLAMKNDSAYINDNFEWFASRYHSFLYVDRIVIGKAFHGLKLGSLLYQDIFQYAKTHGITAITCEYNIIPANEPSRIFHDKFSFQEVGSQWLNNHSKLVSLQMATVETPK